MAIINDNNRNESYETLKKYRFKLNENFINVISSILSAPINLQYYDQYKKGNIYHLDLMEMNNLFENVVKRYNLICEFNKPVGISDEEFSYFHSQYTRYYRMLDKYFKKGKCRFDIEDLFYDDEFNFDDVRKIIIIFKEINKIKQNMYKFRYYKSEKKNIFDSLSYIMRSKELDLIKKEYEYLICKVPIDINKLDELINRINNITKHDYLNKLSDLNDSDVYNYSFIVHSVKTERWHGKFYDPLVSASLINNEFRGLYSSGIGFILDPSSIISANSDDTYTSNNFTSGEFSTVGIQPIIYSYDKIINDCKKREKENPNSKVYNEIVLTDFNPLAVFYYPDEKNFNKRIAVNLKKQVEEFYPNLQIVEIGSKVKKLSDLEEDFKFHV